MKDIREGRGEKKKNVYLSREREKEKKIYVGLQKLRKKVSK